MSSHLAKHLQALQKILDQHTPLTEQERHTLQALLHDLEEQQQADAPIRDALYAMAERLELNHPKLTSALREFLQSLANIGV